MFTPECIRSSGCSSNRSGSGSGSCSGSGSGSGSGSDNIVNSSSCHSIIEWLILKIGEGVVEG